MIHVLRWMAFIPLAIPMFAFALVWYILFIFCWSIEIWIFGLNLRVRVPVTFRLYSYVLDRLGVFIDWVHPDNN